MPRHARIPPTAIIASKHLTRTSRPPRAQSPPNGRANGPTVRMGTGFRSGNRRSDYHTKRYEKAHRTDTLLTACRTADAPVCPVLRHGRRLSERTLRHASLVEPESRRPFITIRKARIPKGELRHRLRAMGPNLLVVGDSVYSNLTTVGVGKPSKRLRQVQRFGDRIFSLHGRKANI